MEFKTFADLAKGRIDSMEEDWRGEGVIGVSIKTILAQDAEEAPAGRRPDAGAPPWEGEDELPEGRPVHPDPELMISGLEAVQAMLCKAADVVLECALTAAEMTDLMNSASSLAGEMTRMHETIRAWR